MTPKQDDDTTQGKKFTLQDLIDMSAELFAQEEDKPLIIYIPKVIARTMKPKQLCYNCKHFECHERQRSILPMPTRQRPQRRRMAMQVLSTR